MDAYEVLGHLGQGSFGSVSKIRRKEDGRIMVWKEICYGEMKEKEKQLLVNEVNILQKLRHPNIVRYYDRIIDKHSTKIYIIMEYCTGGDLSQLISKCKSDRIFIEEEVIWRTLVQILSALHEIHNRKDGVILHRDIKPGNLFLDESRNVKLGDFGLAKILTNSMHAHTFVGTPHYMSPEQITGKYNDKSDVWSVGCLVYEMATHRPPFYDATTHNQLYEKIRDGRYIPISDHYSTELAQVISTMLNVNMTKRPTVEELFSFPPIAFRLKERKLNQYYQNLKSMEEDLKNKEKLLIEREKAVAAKEQEILAKEQILMAKEQQMNGTGVNNVILQQQQILLQQQDKENNQNRMNIAYNNNTQPTMLTKQHSQLPTTQHTQQTQFTQLKRTYTTPINFK
ncbi:protein serine/threonine kinase [Heterostelium album PN500]|uniref:non-specific serine/threonine protein kinase n=1 Tax=Heterostelium pallidum (strain ATCC 26659 / Pp 5 / PN500) TaxID=670386 RepID=D3BUT4_HETP5|nr:protein serine/threonine kinase [Heterostelium album PN500]EFA74872.1 protein serine/threonine kinase [Heterostelium album PN500]|eukprot:XP_020427006.1 protein serine/threonine kinase [Heterostelium album PN500]